MQDKDNNSNEQTTQNLPELPLNHIAYSILRDSGLNNSDASKALKFTPGNGSIISQKLKTKDDLTSSINVKLASNAHRKILSMFVHPDKIKNDTEIEIKGADLTKAIDRVYDRVQPVKRSEEHTSISFIQINVESMK